MLLKTSIYNHNYYPIFAYKIDHKLTDKDGNEFHQIGITDTSFKNDVGMLIKPFQDAEYFTSIDLISDVTSFKAELLYDTTTYTDSYDYSTFGTLSKWQYDINKRAVMVKLDKVSRAILHGSTFDPTDFLDIEFNLRGISDWPELESYLHMMNVTDINIESVGFYSKGINKIARLEKPPKECEIYAEYTAGILKDHYTSDIIAMCDSCNGTYKVLKDEINNDALVKFRVRGDILQNMAASVSSEVLAALNRGTIIMPYMSLPIGMSVVLNLSPKNKSPYKLNIKVYTNIMFFAEYAGLDGQQNLGNADGLEPIRQSIEILYNPAFNRNTVVASPSTIKIFSNPADLYTGHTRLLVYPFRQYGSGDFEAPMEWSILSAELENNDSDVIDGNIILHTDMLPAKKLLLPDTLYLGRNAVDIYVDVKNINSTYQNNIIVTFEYDGNVETMTIPIVVEPIAEYKSDLVISDIFCAESDMIRTERMSNGISKIPTPKLDINVGNVDDSDIITITAVNNGNKNANIKKVELVGFSEFENANIYEDETIILNEETRDAVRNIARYHSVDLLAYGNRYPTSHDTVVTAQSLVDDGFVDSYISYRVLSIENANNNLNNIAPITIKLEVKRLKETKNQFVGKLMLVKITYDDDQVCLSTNRWTALRLVNNKTGLGYEKSQDITYIRPNARNTIFLKLFRTYINNYYPNLGKNSGIQITNVKLINTNDIATDISEDEFFFDKSQLPLTIGATSGNIRTLLNFDLNLKQEKLYQFKLRLYTNISYIPYIEIPYDIMCTSLSAEEIVSFDESDFYVRNNKYFLSLMKNVPKNRTIKIINNTNTEIIIKSITFDLPTSTITMDDMDITQTRNLDFPFVLSNKNPINVNFSFYAKEYGRSTGFIMLDTNLGWVYLPVVIFVNTKIKDVMVLMENRKGAEFKSALNSVDREFIKLVNFGDDLSLTEITKLGYDKHEFLVENNPILFPNSDNYMEVMFAPTSTGKKIGWLDIKIKDMLETYVLADTDLQKTLKIQNSHIIAELVGNALADHALPLFSKSVVDFGYIAANSKDRLMRYDTFEIKNLGLTPFIITSITKSDLDSPFLIPLAGRDLPIRVDKNITLPIWLNNKKLKDDQSVYMDIFKFEMQDLKSKKMFTYDIIVKIELTNVNREYFSFNSEYLQFGYCQINHFKTDAITVKNYSTDKVKLKITTDGIPELQSVENMVINLWPSQTFDVPVYFYPHGISEFRSNLKLDFNDGSYTKNIELFGLGVDFNSPLVYVENKMATYYKSLLDHLGRPKYV